MEEFLKLKKFYELKSIDRQSTNGDRKESSAEHSWSCLILADHFLIDQPKLDKQKVYDLLIYHDVVEIEAGDTPLDLDDPTQEEREREAAKILKEKLPKSLSEKFYNLFIEFEEQKTPEAKFAKAIDKLDPIIQGINYKPKWKGRTKKFLIEKKQPHIRSFPHIEKKFLELLNHLEEEDYFNQ